MHSVCCDCTSQYNSRTCCVCIGCDTIRTQNSVHLTREEDERSIIFVQTLYSVQFTIATETFGESVHIWLTVFFLHASLTLSHNLRDHNNEISVTTEQADEHSQSAFYHLNFKISYQHTSSFNWHCSIDALEPRFNYLHFTFHLRFSQSISNNIHDWTTNSHTKWTE